MEKSTRKKVLIIGSLLVIGGVVGYIFWKRKQDEDDSTTQTPEEENKNVSSGGSKPITSVHTSGNVVTAGSGALTKKEDILKFQKFANAKGIKPALKEDGEWGQKTAKAFKTYGSDFTKSNTSATSNNSGSGYKVSATDLLAGDINAANGKKVYAGAVTKIYNMSNQLSGNAQKGMLLGTVKKVEKTSDGRLFWLFITGTNGVNYKVVANGTLIQN
jgi:hypothetical protein